MDRKLYRDEFHKKIAGVCAGLAEYFNIDVAIVRVIFVLALIFHGGGLLIYIIFWIVLPKKPLFINPNVDYRVPPQNPMDSGNQFTGTPYTNAGTSFSNQPFPNQPYQAPRNSTSLVAIVFGVILIIIGGSILLDDFDIIPDWDFERLWPVVLIVVGCAIMISGERKKPWEQADWNKTNTVEEKPAEDAAPEANPPADNTPTV
ncbi:MAG TPA: PspC domain-containing protein [Mucilaginibacter sp.]|nr:PspC domain-containing protein [Mucilaginibacter sp.]